jgi:RNA polymerase sigma factor (sigma-70 family)
VSESDRGLVLRARGGDQDAFRDLYAAWSRPILGLLRHLFLGDKTKAEDALEETFVRAFAALGQFDVERPFGPWVKEIARNVVRDTQRAQTGPLSREARPEAPEDALSALVRREQEESVLDALVDLPDKERQVLLLRYRRGYTQPETAAELRCSRRTVATLQKSALAHLARMVRERLGKPDPTRTKEEEPRP